MKRSLGNVAWALLPVALLGVAWLALFGAMEPCDALRAQVPEVLKDEKESTRKSVLEATRDWNAVTCTGMALRLRMGDRSALVVVKR